MAWKTDDLVARLAGDQHGIVTRAQLLERGITTHDVTARVRRGRFGLVHRGVYAVGPLRSPCTRAMAAVLACGPSAVVSHVAADDLWQPEQLAGWKPVAAGQNARESSSDVPVDVTIDRGDRRHRPGIRIHRVAFLEAADVTTCVGVPVTTPLRTMLDLAAVVGRRELEQAIGRAERNGLIDRDRLRAWVDARPGRPGSRALRSLLEADAPLAVTRSEAESMLLALIREAQLPAPQTNVSIDRFEVDFLWPVERLIVEVDGFAFHASRHTFENDRRRDASLTARGFRIMRVTWRQIVAEPVAVAARIAQALVRSAVS
jgi:very-short-patch-repair endonuclease